MPRISSTEVVVPGSLRPEQKQEFIDALYKVHCEVFDGVDKDEFGRYVVNSKAEWTWILLQKNEAGEVVGYFALHIYERKLRGVQSAVIRAEAGKARAYRGGSSNARFFIDRVLRYSLAHPRRPLYYLGSLVHPSSYSLFAKYCQPVWPSRGEAPPPEVVAFMDELATSFGLERVSAENPLVRDVGWITRETEMEREYWAHCDKPAARFFVETNPGYQEGHGLLTLAPLDVAGLWHITRQVLREKLGRRVERAFASVLQLPIASFLLQPAQVRRRLLAVPLFEKLDAAGLETLVAAARVEVLPAGAYLFRKGDPGDALYLLVQGAAYVLIEKEGRESLIDEVGSGGLLGEIAALTGQLRTASVRTASASTLIRIHRKALLPLLENQPTLRRALSSTIAERRFDDQVRIFGRFQHLGRVKRRTWFRGGTDRELSAGEAAEFTQGGYVLVSSGLVEIEQGGTWLVASAPALIDVKESLRVVAHEPSNLTHVPPLESEVGGQAVST